MEDIEQNYLNKYLRVPESIRVPIASVLKRVVERPRLKIIEDLDQANSMIHYAEEVITDIKYNLEPFKKENPSWFDTTKKLCMLCKNITSKAGLSAGKIAACEMAQSRVREEFLKFKETLGVKGAKQLAARAALDVYNYVALEFSRRLPDFIKYVPEFRNNPFEGYMRLWDEGLIPWGFRYIRYIGNVERFLVNMPFRFGGRMYFLLYIERDKKISHFHYPGEIWRRIKPIEHLYKV